MSARSNRRLSPACAGFIIAAILTASVALIPGCSVQQQSSSLTPTEASTPARPLPLKGRLVDGDPAELPPAVAMSLSNSSPVTFSYREELTHDDYHIPLIVTALDPVTYMGAPLGDYGVTAFASLAILDGDTVLGDYTAKAHVSKSYSIYSEPTHKELEQAARAEVRHKIDQKLYQDADRLARLVVNTGNAAKTPPASGDR